MTNTVSPKILEFKAALVDLDGFLIGSEEIFLEANRIYFKQFGLDNFTEEMHRSAIGKKAVVEMQGYKDKGIITTDLTPEELMEGRDTVFRRIAGEKLELTTGALGFLKKIHSKYKTALVTSSLRDYVTFIYNKFDISQYFGVNVTGDMVTRGKPDPDPYLVAAKKLGVEAGECIVFEDAPAGVLSGKAAGMKVIAVPNRFVRGDKVFEEADAVFESLVEVTDWLRQNN